MFNISIKIKIDRRQKNPNLTPLQKNIFLYNRKETNLILVATDKLWKKDNNIHSYIDVFKH